MPAAFQTPLFFPTEEEVPSESEEDKRIQEERATQVLTLVKRLEVNDKEIKKFCDEKIKIISKIMSIHGHEGIQSEVMQCLLIITVPVQLPTLAANSHMTDFHFRLTAIAGNRAESSVVMAVLK
jgi:hypothetical protein